MPASVRLRLFLGGCSRSGTTLLQILLAGHSRIHTFPETGVFLRALGMRGHLLPWALLGLTLGKERRSLARLLDQTGPGEPPLPSLPPRRLLMRSSVRDIVAFFDALTSRAGKDIWLEKTPRHVLHASRILRLVPDARFIHIVRDGRDVVASIVDRARRNPGRFRGQEDPAYGIRQWNRSVRATVSALEAPGHLVLRYEDLADRGEEILRALCLQTGIQFEEGMTEPGQNPAFILEEETWKVPRKGPLRRADSKFEAVFDKKTRTKIDDRLDHRSLEVIDGHLRAAPGRVWAFRRPT